MHDSDMVRNGSGSDLAIHVVEVQSGDQNGDVNAQASSDYALRMQVIPREEAFC